MYHYSIFNFFWSDVFKIVSESLFWRHVLPDEFGFTRQTVVNIKPPHILPQPFKLLRIFRPLVNSCMCKVIFRIFQHICMNFISKGLFKIVAWTLTRQLMNMPAFLLFNIWSRDKIWTNALACSKYGGMQELTIGVNILNILKGSQRILYSLSSTVSFRRKNYRGFV
jgi:hypothetical protein